MFLEMKLRYPVATLSIARTARIYLIYRNLQKEGRMHALWLNNNLSLRLML